MSRYMSRSINRSLRLVAMLGSILLPQYNVLAASGWTDYVFISELIATSQYRYLVVLKVSENPSGCRNKNHFYQDYDFPGSEQIFSTLLEAVSSGKAVRVFVTGKCGLSGYAEISSVGIVP